MCGGKEDSLGCSTLQPDGVWLKTHNLIKERRAHVSWEIEEGLILMGGKYSPDDTELGKLNLFCLKVEDHPGVFS